MHSLQFKASQNCDRLSLCAMINPLLQCRLFFFISSCLLLLLQIIISVGGFISISMVAAQAHAQCLTHQKMLLLQFRSSLNFNSTTSIKLARWNHTTHDDCCVWPGVECDSSGHVISLILDNEGIITDGIHNSSALFSLQYLERLNLAFNYFNLKPIPVQIYNLTNLTYLNLSRTGFGGRIPNGISRLTRLVTLDLSFDTNWLFIKLEIPNLNQFLENSTQIRQLYLDGVDLFSTVVVPKFLANFSNLKTLSLRNCNLRGSFPTEIFLIHGLQELSLESNYGLSGGFPSFPENGSLRMVSVGSTHFSGSLPASISNLSSLSRIDLSFCNFSGSIPSTVAQLKSLTYVDFSYNNFTSSIPQFPWSKNLTHIDFYSNGLTGPLSSKHFEGLTKVVYINLGSNYISGRIPPSLFSLPSLQSLDLFNNSFDGFGDEYVNVFTSQLDMLDLNSNRLSGSIPKYFFEFSKLSELYLSSNSLGGKIQSSLFSLPSLQTLDLSNNSFDGLGDEYVNVSTSQLDSLNLSSNCLNGSFSEYFFEFPMLRLLFLSSNSLSGMIQSSMFSLKSLQILDLSKNLFDGFSDEYVNVSISQLESLDLSSNRLNGSFPEYFFEFSMLRDLDLSFNSLSEMIEFESLQKLTNLRLLDLSNNGIRGEIPSWIWELGNGTLYHLNLSCNFLESLEKPHTIPSSLGVLDLHSNQLRGSLPIPPGRIDGDGLLHLDYSHNFFNGSIPFDLGSFARNAYFLSFANNSFTGTIPESICNASNRLEILDLSDNKLGGTLPSCLFNSFNCLEVLNLGKNQIHGSVPDSFTNYCPLQTLDLSRNSFEGKIPKSLINCSFLEVLNVGSNNIVDTFPCALKNLSSLRVLVLRSNNFHGDLQCVNANHMWPNLQIIDIASNNFSGKLSPKFLNWKRMIIDEDTAQSGQYIMFLLPQPVGHGVPDEYYQDIYTLMVTWKGMEMEMMKVLKVFTFVDFSCNNFYGVIPEFIGDLTSLYVLNLSHNGLTGNIPETIGNLKMIESLDLSSNQLGGEIPTELAKLTFLSVLNLSFNFRLSGMIPTGNQLNTFGPDSYLGNKKLCGFPLPKSCKSPKTSNGGRSEIEFDGGSSEIKWEYVTSALGFAVGLGVYLWMLLHNKRCWEAYQQLDEVLIRLFGSRQRGRKSPGLGSRVRRN